jgi:hypothetical protein
VTPARATLRWQVYARLCHGYARAAALRHDTRRGGRDPWLWNVACDYVINGWLTGDEQACGVDLDEFYRRCLADGLAYHRGQGRGLLPGGLIEEIRALTEPPVPWDVELARWFDDHFAPLDRRRSYARASRRQAATRTSLARAGTCRWS